LTRFTTSSACLFLNCRSFVIGLFDLYLSDLPDLLRFCASSKRINDKICNQNDIWYYKLREYPADVVQQLRQETPRQTYTLLYQLTQLQQKLPQLKEYSLVKLYNLKKLILSKNQLTSIPKEIGNLVNLQYLDLSENKLTSLPEEIGNLVNLQYLDLSENQLTSIPEEIGNLVNLQYLYLYNNQLTSLPEEIGNLVNLQTLTLDNNQLTSLPEEIGNLVNLQELYLYDNQLTSVPKEIGNLVNTKIYQ